MSRIISAQELAELRASGRHVVLLDVRFAPGAPNLRPEYEQGHIPGAHFVDLPTQLQGAGGGTAGARPLPDRSSLQRELERWGAREDSVVVAYSNGTAGAAARAWFVLAEAGVEDVRYLDGGLAGWRESGGAITTAEPATGGGTAVLPDPVDRGWQFDADDIEQLASTGLVLDARKRVAYDGDGSERSGHVPGARSLPAGELLEGGLVKSAVEVRELLVAHGYEEGDTVGVYCGGGVAAALSTLVLRESGVDARLFVGSFSAWAADGSRAVASAKTRAHPEERGGRVSGRSPVARRSIR